MEVDHAGVVMSLRKLLIKPDSLFQFAESVWVILILRIGLAEKGGDPGIRAIFLEQFLKNPGGISRLVGTDESSSPGKQKSGTVGWIAQERVKHLRGFRKIILDKIAKAEDLARE